MTSKFILMAYLRSTKKNKKKLYIIAYLFLNKNKFSFPKNLKQNRNSS